MFFSDGRGNFRNKIHSPETGDVKHGRPTRKDLLTMSQVPDAEQGKLGSFESPSKQHPNSRNNIKMHSSYDSLFSFFFCIFL